MAILKCQDCERYKTLDGDRPKFCPTMERTVWPGDNAEECPFLVAIIKGEPLRC